MYTRVRRFCDITYTTTMRVYLGEFEQLLLLALLHLKDDAYGVRIRRGDRGADRAAPCRPARSTPRSTASSDATSSSSRLGDPTAQRGGKRKRYYRLEPAGAALLRESQHALRGWRAGSRRSSRRHDAARLAHAR